MYGLAEGNLIFHNISQSVSRDKKSKQPVTVNYIYIVKLSKLNNNKVTRQRGTKKCSARGTTRAGRGSARVQPGAHPRQAGVHPEFSQGYTPGNQGFSQETARGTARVQKAVQSE